ncbi:MAG TPA: hypothetical protein DIU15_11660 [Deltaproteobacteria bacterium]|nr:hypothetical protein [Deltaproteobacteria bacterium]HCP46694.1 hypothetical protein [Deltaproteobacteria bacterium]
MDMNARSLLNTLLVASILSLLIVSPTDVAAQQSSLQLPKTEVRLLGGEDVNLATQLAGHPTLLVLSFERDQVDDLKSWMAVDRELCTAVPNLRRLSIPVLPSAARFLRRVIDGGMADTVGTEKGCGRTATAYIKKEPLLAALSIKDEQDVSAILVSAEGTVLWRGKGAATPAVIAQLREVLENGGGSVAGL